MKPIKITDKRLSEILEKIFLELKKNKFILGENINLFFNYDSEIEVELFDVEIKDEIVRSPLAKTIDTDLPKMNNYIREWLEQWDFEKSPFSEKRILEIESGSDITSQELKDLRESMLEIEQQSFTYDGNASERCNYALFETLNKNALIYAEKEDDASREAIGFFLDKASLLEYLNQRYYI